MHLVVYIYVLVYVFINLMLKVMKFIKHFEVNSNLVNIVLEL